MVKTIVWIIVGLLALSFFGISIRSLVESPTNQDNVSFILNMVSNGWHLITAWFANFPNYFANFGHFNLSATKTLNSP